MMRAPNMQQQKQTGFTLVELLIVVIILAILAAIVVPQFSATSTDAQEAALDSNLNAIRSAIELYKVQHNNNYPGTAASSGGAAACATKGAGAALSKDAMFDQLLMASDATGATCSVADTNYKF